MGGQQRHRREVNPRSQIRWEGGHNILTPEHALFYFILFDLSCSISSCSILYSTPFYPILSHSIPPCLSHFQVLVQVLKGEVLMGFHGLMNGHIAPILGVDHDERIADDHVEFQTLPNEWQLGDLAYGGLTRCLTGRKLPTGLNEDAWMEADEFFRQLIAFYRGRAENVISRIKCHGWCEGVFRGSFELLMNLWDIAVILLAQEMREDFRVDGFLMFEVVGPWPHDFN